MNILITGDFVVNDNYPTSNIDEEVTNIFHHSDLNIVNLEAPVTTSNTKINKTGPNIKSHRESTKNVLKALEVDVVTLANNHVLDYDEQGVIDTLEFCRENEIQTVGAGKDLEEASKILYVETKEGKIAIVNFAENEWTSATFNSAGSNPMCLINNFKQIKEAKQNADFVITIAHGGHEHYQYPSPDMKKRYRFYAEIGSDAVIAHHTHCIGGFEVYNEVPICYSLGNFLFPKDKSMSDSWYTGLIAELEIEKSKRIKLNLLPIRLDKASNNLTLLEDNEKNNILNELTQINQVIAEPIVLQRKWDDYVKRVQPSIVK